MDEPNDGVIALKPLNQAGPGATIVAVKDVEGGVVLQFPMAVQWLTLDPQTAVMVGEAMARAAFKIRHGREPRENVDVLAEEIKRKTTDLVRQKMINRTVLILRTLQEKKRDLNYQATEVVDRILQEVT